MTDAASPVPPEPTASPAPGVLDPIPGEWRRVSGKYVIVDLVSTIIWGAIFVAAGVIPLVVLGWGGWWWLVPAAVAIITIVTAALTPRRVRSIGYLLRDDDLLFRRGIMFQRFVSVPFGRMQLVDITRGPLARALGLAELKLVTAAASTGVVIPGLTLEDAEALRDHLVALAETRRAGL